MKHCCLLPRRRSLCVPAWIAMALASLAPAQTVQITSPSTGTVVNPGQTLTVTVAVSGATLIHAFAAGDTPIGFSQDLTSPPYQFNIQIPTGIKARSYVLTAAGVDALGNLYNSSPVAIDVERTDDPVSIGVNLSSLNKVIGDTAYLRVSATYSDASVLDVTESSLVSYASDTTAVATVDNVGRVTAVGPGSANITITYGTLSSTVPIVVPAPLTILPATASLYGSQTEKFDAYFAPVPDSGTDVAWTLRPSVGTIDADGLYTAPDSVSSWQGVTVTATSAADPTKSASAQIWIFPPVTLALSPASATLLAGQHLELSANRNNDGGAGVAMSVTPGDVGSFWQTSNPMAFPYPIPLGEYTAPAPILSPQVVTVTATSAYDNSKIATAQVTLVPSVALSVAPTTATIYSTASIQLTPTVNYSSKGTVTWSLDPIIGTITTSGLYTAPADVTAQQTVTVTATSVDGTDTWGANSGGATYTAATTITILPQPASGAITVPGSLQASVISNSEIDLTWTPSTESGASIAGYHIFRNGAWTATSLTPSFADRGLLASTAYTYTIAAFDGNWNASAKSASAGGTTLAGTPNLVAHYNFDEGSGTALYDSSGNGNNGAITGTATWSSSGKTGNALVFDGTSTLVTVPSTSSLSPTTGMTLEAWVNPTAWSGGNIAMFLSKYIDGTSVGDECYALYASASGVNYGLGTTLDSAYSGATQILPLNTWTNMALTYDGTVVTYFLNGQQASTLAMTGDIRTSAQPLFIGGVQPFGDFFNGMIDEIRIYDRALSQSEIQSDIVASSPQPPTLSAITPASGVQGTNIPVTIQGTHFLPGSTVNVSNPGIAVSGVTVVSPTQITATFAIAAGTTPGALNVTVTTSAGTSNAATFTVTAPLPTITNLSPSVVTTGGAAFTLTITGTSFLPGTVTTFAGSALTTTFASATKLTAAVPASAIATGGQKNVSVTTSNGTSANIEFVMVVVPLQ